MRTRLRLSQRVAANLFPARERQKKSLLLFPGAVTMNRIAEQRILHAQYHARGSAAPRYLFNHNGVSDVVESRSAFRLRECHPRQAKLRSLAEKFPRILPGLIVVPGERPHFGFR